MKTILLLSALAASALAAPEARFSCSECVDEMHKLGWMVKMGAVPIHDYVSANYCPTLGEDQAWCEEALARQEVPVTLPRSTLVTSAFRAWNGSRLTLKTRS